MWQTLRTDSKLQNKEGLSKMLFPAYFYLGVLWKTKFIFRTDLDIKFRILLVSNEQQNLIMFQTGSFKIIDDKCFLYYTLYKLFTRIKLFHLFSVKWDDMFILCWM